MNYIEYIEKYGFPWMLAILFIGFVVYYFKRIAPELEGMKNQLIVNMKYDKDLEIITQNSNRALEEVARSNDNVANSLNVLNITMTGQMEIMKLLYDDTKETQARLYTHDDRSEKIFTMLRELDKDLKEALGVKNEKNRD